MMDFEAALRASPDFLPERARNDTHDDKAISVPKAKSGVRLRAAATSTPLITAGHDGALVKLENCLMENRWTNEDLIMRVVNPAVKEIVKIVTKHLSNMIKELLGDIMRTLFQNA